MKIFVFILVIFSLSISLNADWLYGKNDKCVNDFYYKNGTFYYHYSKDDNGSNWHSTTSNNYYKYLYSGFSYDPSTNICSNRDYLGLTSFGYNFMYALTGLLFGFLMFWLIPGTKK